jgi:tRNA 2-thiouridine synthesizing protein C
MSQKSLAILNSHSPFYKTQGRDALDIALIFGSFEQKVAIFFQGEGVRQLIAEQHAEALKAKDYLATFSALPFYDVEELYVCQKSLTERGLAEHFHVDNVISLSVEDFAAKIQQFDIVLRF